MPRVIGAIVLWLAGTTCLFAQTGSTPAGVPVSMIVTVESPSSLPMPDISRQDVMVHQGHTRAKVTGWEPFAGDRAGLELFVLLDDSPDISRGTQLEDLRNFILAQPATTKIGVAYMQIGSPQIAQPVTTDHALAAKAVRVSLSELASSVSPYFSLSELIKNWPTGAARREVLMVSNGIDYQWEGTMAGKDNPYVNSAIEQAQRAGIVILTVSTSSAGHYLSQIADETGGRAYNQGFGSAVSIAPYLSDSAQRLSRQFLLTFLAKAEKKGGMQAVKINTEVPHAKLVSADKVYVPAVGQ